MADSTRYWTEHLTSTDGGMFHFLDEGQRDVPQIRDAAKALSFNVFTLVGSSMTAMPGVMTEFARALSLPRYFGRSWDALLDLTRDLSWTPAQGYVAIVEDTDALSELDSLAFENLAGVLQETVRDWRDERGERGERQNSTAFHVVLSGIGRASRNLKEILFEPYCEHTSGPSHVVERRPGGVLTFEAFRQASAAYASSPDVESILELFRKRGLSRARCAYVVAAVLQKPIPDVLEIMGLSQSWRDLDEDAPFREAARRGLDKLDWPDK